MSSVPGTYMLWQSYTTAVEQTTERGERCTTLTTGLLLLNYECYYCCTSTYYCMVRQTVAVVSSGNDSVAVRRT